MYLGESLVLVVNNKIQIYCINTTACEVELTLPPVEIEEFEVMEPTPRFAKRAVNSENSTNSHRDRFQKLISELDSTNLNAEEKRNLLKTIEKFPYQFFIKGDKLGCTNVVKHVINTINEEPVRKPNHRLPIFQREFVEKEAKALLDEGKIQQSDSPYNSPAWVVPKNADPQGNRRWWMVIDYRLLNEKTVEDAYPLPNITDILDQLGGSKYLQC